MGKRIQPHQIETARTAFRNGKSIPECCSIAGISKASFNKYLGSEIEMWTQERLDNEAQQARADILPDDNKIMLEVQQEQDRLVAEELDMTDDQFISLLEYKFSQVDNYEQARELYWEYKNPSIINIKRVEAFRVMYEQCLNRVTGRPTAKPNNEVIIDGGTVESLEENLAGTERYLDKLKTDGNVGRLQWGTEISELNKRFNLTINQPSKNSMLTWDTCRYLEHIYFWLRKACNNPKQFVGISKFLKLESDKARRQLINEVIAQLESEM